MTQTIGLEQHLTQAQARKPKRTKHDLSRSKQAGRIERYRESGAALATMSLKVVSIKAAVAMNLGSMSAVALKRTRLRYQSDLAKLTPHQESIATNGAIQVYTLHGDVAFKPLMMTPVTAQGATTAPYARPWLLALISIPRPSFGST